MVPLFLPVPHSCITLLCGVYGGLVAVLSVVATDTTVITGHIAVLLIDSSSPQCRSGQHPQKVRVHLLVNMLTVRCCRRHLLLEAVVCGRRDRHRRSLGAQHVRWHVCMAVRVSVEGAVGGRVCMRWSGGEEGGQGGSTIGLVRRLGLGEVAVTAQARKLEERRRNAEYLPCCHLVGGEE